LQMLIEAGGNMFAKSKYVLLLYVAAKNGYDTIVEALLQAGADVDHGKMTGKLDDTSGHYCVLRLEEGTYSRLGCSLRQGPNSWYT